MIQLGSRKKDCKTGQFIFSDCLIGVHFGGWLTVTKYPISVFDYIDEHIRWSCNHKRLLRILLQEAAENNANYVMQYPSAEYLPDFFLGTTSAGYRLFAGERSRHQYLHFIPGFANTLLDYKNFPTFRNIAEVQQALEPAQKIHFLLEGLKPNKYLQARFRNSDVSDMKPVCDRKWGVLEWGDTEVEFLTVSCCIELLNKTTFYNDGRIITYSDALEVLKLPIFER